jgi:acyl transferase domain-containing protein/NAD(P)H-dependent flavin oxidoreductase YrpB (nitropropane dioxygenase family)
MDYLSVEEARTTLETLVQAHTHFMVSIPYAGQEIRALLSPTISIGVNGVVLTDPASRSFVESVTWCHGAGLEVLVQVETLAEALHAVENGADGLVVKGSESGGRVGEETVYILLQRILPHVKVPMYARGGIGLHSASACLAAGAAGAALDWQLALAEESTLPEAVKARIARMDGSETAILGQDSKIRYRAYSRVGETAYFDLKKFEESEGVDAEATPETLARWQEAVSDRIRKRELLTFGQDAAFASYLTDQFRTVRGICLAIRREASRQVRVASRLNPLSENGPLAQSHGTRFPILQGPMTRVSDNADFALAVAQGGALPFLALALMRGSQVGTLLEETKVKLGKLPWGVGILGFVPKELRDEQLAEVKKTKPPFIVIAGGRPDMAKQFEADGMTVYLHVPSPELTRNFLEAGARRVIFEGRECGGHVGPRTSFVLWDQMVRVILNHLRGAGANTKPEDYHIIFAGGIHDARSAAMVAAITAPLAERGVRIGVVIGTGYLFTNEIVSTRAITATFQEEAIACRETVLVESGVGHATRCADSPFAKAFADEKRRMLREGKPKEEMRIHLEGLNLGRLRIASKGVIRHNDDAGKGKYEKADAETVRQKGMFMIGQVAALRESICSVEELHRDCASGGVLLNERVSALLAEYKTDGRFPNSDIAIVGVSCILPKAADLKEYWQNILNKRYAITEVPKDRWDTEVYFDPDRRARDKVYSKWGGFIDDVVIDPVKFGMPPNSLPSIEPMQLMALEFVQRALADAGYTERKFKRERTCCIVGTGGGVGDLGMAYGFRSLLPYYIDQAGGSLADSAGMMEKLGENLPEWTEDSFAGLLLNVVAGRVANRFDFGGTNFTVDAACATSMAAIRHAVVELETRSSDVAVAVATDMMQTPFSYLCFSKTQALSPTGEPRCFDAAGDGIVISEGVGVLIMKRLDDAILDGDRIYGVLKSVGASSDGKDKGLTAPRPIGQIRAFERAYEKSGFDPKTVGLIEAHGTGTVVGDRTETESLSAYFGQLGADRQSIAVGSVKSMIGHTKCTAGMAGLIKAMMAVRQRALPPTMGVTKPAKTDLGQSPLFINTETRPWLRRLDGAPRRAGASAFGFGGTNFHSVLEEFRSPDRSDIEDSSYRDWPAELFLFRGQSAQEITSAIDQIQAALEQGAKPLLGDLAATVYWEKGRNAVAQCLAIVATSLEDLAQKLESARTVVAAGKDHKDPRGVYYATNSAAPLGKIAFSFPGQGSQSVGMLSDLAVAFPRVLDAFEEADSSLGLQLGKPLSSYIFPPSVFSDADREANEKALKQTNVAQPALGAADMAMFRLLDDMGIRPEFACGHSYGEFAALAAAGTFTLPELIRISELRGRVIVESAKGELGTMAAAEGGEAQIAPVIKGIEGVVIANLNGPLQTVISGTEKGVAAAVEKLKTAGIKARPVAVACAFHSPLVAKAKEPLKTGLQACDLKSPRFAVFSNTTTAAHSADPEATRNLLADHLAKPVRFAEEIQALYNAGARIFVECGPGRILTSLTSSILSGQPHVSINMDQQGKPGLVQLAHALAQLAVAGVPFFAYRLFEGRVTRNLRLDKLVAETQPAKLSPTAWVITNARAVPGALYQKPEGKKLPANPAVRKTGQNVLLNLNGGAPQPAKPTMMPTTNNPAPVPVATPPVETRVVAQPVANTATPPMAAVVNTGPAFAPVMSPPAIPASQMEMAMRGHHQLMSKFLDTHRNIMLAFMQPGVPVTAAPATSYAVPMEAAPAYAQPVAAPAPVPQVPMQAAVMAVAAAAAAAPVVAPAAVVAVTPAPAPVPVAAAPAAPRFNRDAMTKQLVELVSQRTGYPADMLGLDLDLEADLGVDSIKRVEIFGALQNESALPASAMEGQIEALSKLKTLRAIVDWLESKAAEIEGELVVSKKSNAAPEAIVTSPAAAAAKVPEVKPVTRLLVEVVDAPAIEASSQQPGFVLITDDRAGVAAALAQRLTKLGITHRVIERDAELCEAAAVAKLVESVRAAHGPVSALVHLMPLAPVSAEEAAELETRTLRDLKPLYLLSKTLEADLRKAGMVLAATRLGGSFGFQSKDFFAGNGAIAGFIKTLPREWSDVAAKTVDFETTTSAEEIAHTLATEMLCRDGLTEVGYAAGHRRTLWSVPTPVDREASTLKLDRDSVILVTGGARGITADTAIELAKAFHPKFVLLGRSPLPPAQEPADIAGVKDTRKLKAIVMDRMQTGGQRPTPALIEGAVKRIKNEREIRENVAALKALSAEVEYHPVDVCDSAAVGKLIDDIYSRHGRIDGVVHGAGVIEDKLIGDKTPESFERVIKPKVTGAMALVRKLQPENLQFLVFYSSVSARYGNRGQCDYSAANEVLNKLAEHLNHRWPGRVVSMNWGPWQTEGGMVSPELAARFRAAGVELIEVPAGCRAFVEELRFGRKEDVEVVFGGPLTIEQQAPGLKTAAAAKPAGYPMAVSITSHADGKLEASLETHPARHMFLQDHRIDGRPVLPMVLAIEIFSEIAATVKPDTPLTAIRNLRVLQGISYSDEAGRELHVEGAMRNGSGQPTSFDLLLKSPTGQMHYRAQIECGGARPPAPPRLELVNQRPFPLTVPQAYDQWLFHGPMLAGITDIIAMGDNGVIGKLRPSDPKSLIQPPPAGRWLVDPVVTDSALQLTLIWARAMFDQTPLPSAMETYVHVKPLSGVKEILCELEILSQPGNPTLRCRPVFYDESGHVLGWMEGMEVTMSKALNRLAKGAHATSL